MKVLVVLVCLLLVSAFAGSVEEAKDVELSEERSQPVKKACPNACSGHGQCLVSSVCNCDAGYAGDDCSIPDQLATSGITYSNTVPTRQWQYYHIDVTSASSGIIIEVNQTTIMGDCDLYIRKGNYPSRTIYDWRDATTTMTMKYTNTNPGQGIQYAGVYGFVGCAYQFRATITSNCPNDCSGHGTCSTATGLCICQVGYSGSDCSQGVQALTAGVPVTGSLAIRQWIYYSYTVVSTNNVRWTVNQTTTGDVDMYLKFGQLPTLTSSDYSDITGLQYFYIDLTNPAVGVWYCGLYGYAATGYILTLSATTSCPNNCSGVSHGTCSSSSSCSCNSDYTGNYCQTRIPAMQVNASPLTGYVSDNSWNYYRANAFSALNLAINVAQIPPQGDCDLYIKADVNPTRTNYQYRDISLNQNFSIVIQNPGDTTWYIGVYGYASCSYLINAITTAACPNNCNNHGVCVNARCQCNSGYSGDDCGSSLSQLSSGQVVLGGVSANQWSYYTVSVTNFTSSVNVYLSETNSTGLLWLYVDTETYPTLSQYTLSDTTSTASLHKIYVKRPSPTTPIRSTLYVGVYGNPNSPPNRAVPFKLSVFVLSI